MTKSCHTNDHHLLYVPSQMVVHVSFLMVVKLKQGTNLSSLTELQYSGLISCAAQHFNIVFIWPLDMALAEKL